MTGLIPPNFRHLLSLRGPYGTFEHAKGTVARIEHGYCTDDVARVAVVVARQSGQPLEMGLEELLWSSLHFLELAQHADGRFMNRRDRTGNWELPATSDDCWGRAMWGLGTISAQSRDTVLRERAMAAFVRGASVRSNWPRSMALAVLGATEFLRVDPNSAVARRLLVAGVAMLDRECVSEEWCWPETRLSYANASLPDALIAAGIFTGDERIMDRGLGQLRWLLAGETLNGHLSVTPVGGRGPRDPRGTFDQQPIEVAALSDACVRAEMITGDATWGAGRRLCEGWFAGDNDVGAVMYDVITGGGYDGLTQDGPNINQGAESTLSLLMVQQHAHRAVLAAS